MNYHDLTPMALAELIGERIQTYRLNANMTQQEIAEITGLNRTTIKNVESGRCKVETLMATMLALGIVDHLDSFLPPIDLSPIQLAKMKGYQRVRASNRRKPSNKTKSPEDKADDGNKEDLGW
ncbi:helix-turn-helix domain-containing protein [Photobacterium sp. WH77]|uniref:Helix-turn-helix transcriptional regulator n=1 Tax=Photobacterium arenosum TaxID=2774143 RepID=A0ABR9BFA6_9GAMM|nr:MULTISPECIES: helix-turn-helix transcriptional regulator [Photobacterium]MBD8511240.1 helix-turn-helix transcriptional regulator [Photobacterium arenosum]MBV7263119.1 helix-turn-helix transcriptional regulator [Photobacterium sp. WH24]MCG2837897.1 helix-turn-helix domain-containing protein [Photobacterium sp. WH77]MCG2845515.1 helix-turn-helix domain-containing protein [Photobacterium sp. WH80]MDO6581903.1 helix-turn-helix transcriptional regulator [Photobacterium sp. 2_MG-2023]